MSYHVKVPSQPDRRGAGELEAQILGILWTGENGLGAADVLERLGGNMAYTTVAKVLDRLHAKGQLTRTRTGRHYSYKPVAAEANWVAGQIKRLVGRGGNRSAVLQGFVDGLDSTDSTILAELLDEAQRRRREDPEPDGRT